jgi:hypothetical protein
MTDEGSASHLRGVSANWTCVELGQGRAARSPSPGRGGSARFLARQGGVNRKRLAWGSPHPARHRRATLPFQGRVGARGTVSNQTGTEKLDIFAPTLVTQALLDGDIFQRIESPRQLLIGRRRAFRFLIYNPRRGPPARHNRRGIRPA